MDRAQGSAPSRSLEKETVYRRVPATCAPLPCSLTAHARLAPRHPCKRGRAGSKALAVPVNPEIPGATPRGVRLRVDVRGHVDRLGQVADAHFESGLDLVQDLGVLVTGDE